MSENAPQSPSSSPTPETTPSTEFPLAYAGPSRVATAGNESQAVLVGESHRSDVRFDARIRDPLRWREAMWALHAAVAADFRYVPKDKTAYLAYQQMKKETAGLSAWQAQLVFFTWVIRNDPAGGSGALDPLVTVHPDALVLEVFSKDEGAYAALSMAKSAFETADGTAYGTTNVDFGSALLAGLQQMRSRRQTRLTVSREAVGLGTPAAPTGSSVIEKRVRVPDTWLRGFLQVQSAATLPRDSFRLAAIDLYNLLRQLRMKADIKGKRRGLRVELVPGEPPRLVLEPWETVLTAASGAYQGRTAKVVRVWGRRRLMLLARLLPFVEHVDVGLLGAGLPSFWVLRAGDFAFTLGLTGFTSANWSQTVGFDLLLPRQSTTADAENAVVKHLAGGVWFATSTNLSKATGLKGSALTAALQSACQSGRVMFDLAADVYRLRPISDAPVDLAKLQFRNPRERSAHDLLARRGAVEIVTENRIVGEGLELVGKVTVTQDRRDYRPKLMLGDEGQVSQVECTCSLFRKQGLKAGPCEHLIALRLAYAKAEAERAASGDARKTVTVETRLFSRRRREKEEVVRVSLERKRLRVGRGRAGATLSTQTLLFNSPDDARSAYFARLDELTAHGYIDATTG